MKLFNKQLYFITKFNMDASVNKLMKVKLRQNKYNFFLLVFDNLFICNCYEILNSKRKRKSKVP